MIAKELLIKNFANLRDRTNGGQKQRRNDRPKKKLPIETMWDNLDREWNKDQVQ